MFYCLLTYCSLIITSLFATVIYLAIPISEIVIGVIFKTATPFETPMKMADLIEWTNKAFELKETHPLIITGIFIVIFLAIHPFQDGNGRLSRILTNLLLLKLG